MDQSMLRKLPLELRIHIYNDVLDDDTLDSTSLSTPHGYRSCYIRLAESSENRDFFRLLHICRQSRADIITNLFGTWMFTFDLTSLMCILQLFTRGMRLHVQHVRLVGHFTGSFRDEDRINIQRPFMKARLQDFSTEHHSRSEVDLRYMGIRDMLHVHRGLPNMRTLSLYPLSIWWGERQPPIRILESLLEICGLESVIVDTRRFGPSDPERVFCHPACRDKVDENRREQKAEAEALENALQATILLDPDPLPF